jgi:HAMP domain-containing protein
MSISLKFNIVMLAAFLAGLALAAVFINSITQVTARRAVLSEAATMMAGVNGTIHYTDSRVTPLLARQMTVQFLPEAIPFFAAQQTFDLVAKEHPDYTFRQPADNPTNPLDRPTEQEAEIIQTLRAQPRLTTLTTERQTSSGAILSLSQPVRVDSKTCLTCHSTPETAPSSMIDVYGTNNGFGWKLGDIVGAQIVSVPEQVALNRARSSLIGIMSALAIVFAVMMLLLNLLLRVFIIAPVRRISRTADQVSLGNLSVPEFEHGGRDEIGSLAQAFNRMRRSLVAALRLLEE